MLSKASGTGISLSMILARKEEGYMQQEFGREYERYVSRTGMFLPSFHRKDSSLSN